MIDLQPKCLELVKRILAEHVSDCEVRAFGSRVTGDAKPYSDLDLVVYGCPEMDWRRLEALKDTFSESDLPIMVDVVDGNTVSPEFQRIVERQYEVIQEPHCR